VNELVKTAKYHAVVAEANPRNMPVPGKTKGGPDFLFYAGSTLNSSSFVGDVAISSSSRMGTVFGKKMRTYANFSPLINGVTLPFVMNTRGAICYKTMSILEKLHVTKSFIIDVVINSQCALFKALAASFFRLSVRPSDDEFNSLSDNEIDESLGTDDSDDDTGDVGHE
jgi:hypothetical protein